MLAIPRLGWLGLAVMAIGFGLDAVAHIAGTGGRSGFTLGQHGAHLVVLVGMVVVLGAAIVDGRRRSSSRQAAGRSHSDAHR